MTELSPIRNLNKLKALLRRIWNGELEHNQRNYYSCGTSACVCGWDYAIDMFDGNLIDAEKNVILDYEDNGPWTYSQAKYNLTTAEAYLLFNSKSTVPLQKLTLSALEKGKRLELFYSPCYDVIPADRAIDSDFYHNSPMICLALPTEVLDFLYSEEPTP
jgi:hypothetical protein